LFIGINITGAFTGFADISGSFRGTVETIGTSLTTWTRIAWQTFAMDLIARLGNLTACGKVIGIEGEGAGTDHAIVGRAMCGIAIVACHTFLAMIASC